MVNGVYLQQMVRRIAYNLYSLYVALACMIGINAHAQENLVLNGGFEENVDLSGINAFNQDMQPGRVITRYWGQPTMGTADFWNARNTQIRLKRKGGLIPLADAHSGQARTGLLLNNYKAFNHTRKVYGEYMSTRLAQTLEAGKTYYFECHVLLDPHSTYSASNIGAHFSAQYIRQNQLTYLERTPQVVFTNTTVLAKRGEWTKLSGSFVAQGGEQYMTIGCFAYTGACITGHKLPKPAGQYMPNAYYYFDDIKLLEDATGTLSPGENMTLLVDISTSMFKEGYMAQVKSSMAAFIAAQSKNTRISLITFGDGVTVHSIAQQYTDTAVWNNMTGRLQPGGATNIARAVQKAFALADSLQHTAPRNRVILFTDARFTVDKETQQLLRQHIAGNTVEFDLYQFGNYHNAALVNAVEKPGGRYTRSPGPIGQMLAAENTCDCGDDFARLIKRSKRRPLWRGIGVLAAIGAGVAVIVAN